MLSRIQPFFRGARMANFQRVMALRPHTRILDLGGTTEIWQHIETPLDITIVNLPGVSKHDGVQSHHRFTFLDGDATDLDFPDGSFDMIFSNSVIEHVGGPANELRFADQVRRLAPAYWVQTPSKWFPLEPHSGVPFWWFLPRTIRNMMHRRWAVRVPAWNDMVKGTTVLEKSALKTYFPDARFQIERVLGIPKSYSVYRRAAAPESATASDALTEKPLENA
jgi:hypothetical protein